VDGYTHEICSGPAGLDDVANLELPFPQPRFDLRKDKFNASAVHLQFSDSSRQSG
jgi:hypothetical protein